MQETINYNLKKPEANDNVNIEDFNFNFDKIDEKLFAVIQAWEKFKASGGEIGGDIIIPRGKQIKSEANGIVNALIWQGTEGVDSGAVMVGSTLQRTEIVSEVKPTTWYNGTRKNIIDSSDYISSKDANGYTKLPNGIIIQWGLIKTTLTADGQNITGTITLPIQFPNACRFAEGRPIFVDGGSYKASLYNGAITVINNSTLQMYFMRHITGPTISEPVDVTWIAIGY